MSGAGGAGRTAPFDRNRLLLGTLALAGAVTAGVTWLLVTGRLDLGLRASPIATAALLLLNLLPAIGFIVMVGRRLGRRRANPYLVAGGDLHSKLVTVFSLVATVPTLVMVVIASFLFQYGFGYWFGAPARSVVVGAAQIAQQSYSLEADRVARNTEAMAGDLSDALARLPLEHPDFRNYFIVQLLQRDLSEGAILRRTPKGEVISLAVIDPYGTNFAKTLKADLLVGTQTRSFPTASGVAAVTRLPLVAGNYVYASRVDASFASQIAQSKQLMTSLDSYYTDAGTVQVQLNVVLYLIALGLVSLAVALALRVADRVVSPIGRLIVATNEVGAGNLSYRADVGSTQDEIAQLGGAFNSMAAQLQEQRITLETRRALIEAVLAGVSAGVMAVHDDGRLRLYNTSASELLALEPADIGQPLAATHPALAPFLEGGLAEDIIEVRARDGKERTLAIRAVADEGGKVLTFDDITQRLADQRRAAWADVARRVAHEIKNPLTPIQLAAERLRRRFREQVTGDVETFDRLTDTIVRQVGDLRHMVDEFSAFARLPRAEPVLCDLSEITRDTALLQEVANPGIRYHYALPERLELMCDRGQIAQALTNILKNSSEAILENGSGQGGNIWLGLTREGDHARLTIADDGKGLPPERGEIMEPYITTRANGTGLGLAIVQRIVSDHRASIELDDRPQGGTIVTIRLPIGPAKTA